MRGFQRERIAADANLITVAKHMKLMGLSAIEFIETSTWDRDQRRELAKELFRLKLTTFGEYNHPQYDIFWE